MMKIDDDILGAAPVLDEGDVPPSRQEGSWAPVTKKMKVDQVPEGVTAINVQGRPPSGALQGFGQLWKKTYRIRLKGINDTEKDVMNNWKAHFPEFQPPGNRFFPPSGGFEPGKVMFIDSPLPVVPPRYDKPGLVPMTSAVMILYSDDVSFAVMTPEGFPVAGWNNFSVFKEDDTLVAQVQSYERASDPIYEFGFRLMGGARRQEFIWVHVLTSLAEFYNIDAEVEKSRECLDPKLQWSSAGNVWQNAGIRTTIYRLASPIRWLRDRLKL